MSKPRLCVVCIRRPRAGVLLCEACSESYDRARAKDSTTWAAIAWAATRARGYVNSGRATPEAK